ncbi:ATP-binding cassette domain-containing protein [Nocardioides alcanivorans]|uniref:ATP-binding cassette domain-containing protein n=1 Tax=Nocardioides alcanivorans TaxID=2897352 RepID=UPI001F1FE4AE|nr:ATP-binding cassette domain-containing protein [Nocardioides alcanivorans]
MLNDAPVLSITDGTVPIAGRPVLRHVNLTVRTGEFIALMGANGSGKSTLLRALTGLRPLSRGSVEVFGVPLPRFKEWSRVGFVPQRSSATGGVPTSVWEVVSTGRLGRRRLGRPLLPATGPRSRRPSRWSASSTVAVTA